MIERRLQIGKRYTIIWTNEDYTELDDETMDKNRVEIVLDNLSIKNSWRIWNKDHEELLD